MKRNGLLLGIITIALIVWAFTGCTNLPKPLLDEDINKIAVPPPDTGDPASFSNLKGFHELIQDLNSALQIVLDKDQFRQLNDAFLVKDESYDGVRIRAKLLRKYLEERKQP